MTVHESLLKRKIIHFDMDAFYASVEIRDNPALKGKPLVIGGSPNSRSVVSTASYEARKFGIRSAMASSVAARLCPHAIFLRPNFEKYRLASMQIREIFKQYTDLVEPLSLDEAFLDVTQNSKGLYAVKIAKLIQEEILAKIGLTGSAGIAPNKLVAKIATDMKKPMGLTVVLPEQVREFMRRLPLRKIHGVGPATEKRLAELHLHICEDVWSQDPLILEEKLGSTGPWIFRRAQGLDDRPVEVSHVRKSLGQEETFATDLSDKAKMRVELEPMVQGVVESLQKRNLKGKTITLKIRLHDFVRITRSKSLDFFTNSPEPVRETIFKLLDDYDLGANKVRLLGVSMSNFDGQPP